MSELKRVVIKEVKTKYNPYGSSYIMKCLICGKHFKIKRASYTNGEGKYCSHKCYSKAKSLRRGANTNRWNGGRAVAIHYIWKYDPEHPFRFHDRYILEHRLVMENAINRLLDPKEIVHHIDKNGKNNDLINLVLIPSQADHLKLHRQLKREFNQ